jgi:acetyl esterase/lipase
MKFGVLLMVLVSVQGFGQNNIQFPIWPDAIPGQTVAKQPVEQVLDSADQVLRITRVTEPTLTVFEPDATKRNGAGIIISPGGGYHILAANLEGDEIAAWFSKQGYTAFVLHYRVPNKREGALQDLQRAIRMVRSTATKWNLDPNKIGVMGFSAGGSLSARASTQYATDTYAKIDTVDDALSRPDFTILIYSAYLDQGENRTLTPELIVDAQTPPMFIFATADDPHANSSLVMATALRDAKVPVELHLMPYGGHGYGLREGKPAAEVWPRLAALWLQSLWITN